MLNFNTLKKNLITKEVDIAPLVIFRILFSVLMLGSLLRFWLNGWIYDFYIMPKMHFKYFGFEWVEPLRVSGMYILFGVAIAATIFMMVGLFYRIASVVFFLSFTYIELIDKTTYLNHYYFISLMALLMIFLPAHRFFSFDAKRNSNIQSRKIQAWSINVLKLQLGLVYFYAGIAKLNYDWLVNAQPLKMWLPVHAAKPVIGFLFKYTWIAYVFSWFGALYDLLIPFLLLSKKFRPFAYAAVIAFHALTYWLFPIGMFPFIMICSTLIFFSEDFHKKLLFKLEQLFNWNPQILNSNPAIVSQPLLSVLALFFIFQVVFPFRYLAYEGPLFWHEQGYRFGWRVMLMEKAGSAFFYATDKATKQKVEIRNCDYLTAGQEKMMATQPDMIVQFANYIAEDLKTKGWENPEVTSEVYVTLNGSGSRPFIDPTINLAELEDSWQEKTWILPFK